MYGCSEGCPWSFFWGLFVRPVLLRHKHSKSTDNNWCASSLYSTIGGQSALVPTLFGSWRDTDGSKTGGTWASCSLHIILLGIYYEEWARVSWSWLDFCSYLSWISTFPLDPAPKHRLKLSEPSWMDWTATWGAWWSSLLSSSNQVFIFCFIRKFKLASASWLLFDLVYDKWTMGWVIYNPSDRVAWRPITWYLRKFCRCLLFSGQCNIRKFRSECTVLAAVTVVVNVNNYPPVSQPTGYPQLPASAPVVVQQSVTNSRSGGDLNSQNVAGGGIVTQQGNLKKIVTEFHTMGHCIHHCQLICMFQINATTEEH